MTTDSLEKRVEELAAEVRHLRERVEELSHGMVRMATEVLPEEVSAAEAKRAASRSVSSSDGIAAWAGSSSLLPRVSTLCFLLVVALILRTVTDSGIIEKHAGAVIGMVYAASLMIVGWLRYRKGSAIAPVFAISGAILIFSIVIETHSRFFSLPTAPAYMLLAATGLWMAFTGFAAKSQVPVIVGTLGMCFAGVAINFSVPVFPLLVILLLIANIIAYLMAPVLKRDWLRWIVFFITAGVVQVWSFRLAAVLHDPEFPSPPLYLPWFLPLAALLALFAFGSAIRGMIRAGEENKRFFDYVVPTLAAMAYFTAARNVVVPLWQGGIGLGAAGIAAATAHLGAASIMVRSRRLGALEFNSFTFAAVVWLVLALSAATGALLVALPLISAAALHLVTISDRWQSGGTRVISYLMQVFAALALSLILTAGEPRVPLFLIAAASGAVAVFALLHYRWCRRKSPPAESYFFSRYDRRDYTGAAVLLASLAGWYFFFRLGAYVLLLQSYAPGEVKNPLSGIQSLLINGGAITFFVLSYLRRNREFRNVAILITLIGAGKVFLYDLVAVEGLPRVFSVFSFGIVAAVASYVLGRWQRVGALPPGETATVERVRGSEQA